MNFCTYSDPDCLKVAHAGLTRFKGDSDLIVVDVPARHEQEADLFDEMLQIAENIVITLSESSYILLPC